MKGREFLFLPQKNWNVWAAKLQTNSSSRKAGTNKVSKINKIFQYTSLHFDFGVNTLELSSFLCVFPLLSFFFLEWQPCHSYAEGFGFHQNHHTTIYIWQFSIFLLIKKTNLHLYKTAMPLLLLFNIWQLCTQRETG